jgi:hypothetical protein
MSTTMSMEGGPMPTRFWVWLATTLIGGFAIGTAVLFAVASASSATGMATDEREIVIAAVLILWCAGCLGLAALIGRALGIARPTWTNLGLPTGIGLLAALLGYWLAVETRRGATLDIDNMGMAVLLPVLLLLVSVAIAAAAWSTDAVRLGWLAIAGTAATVFVIGVSVNFFNAGFPGAWSAGIAFVAAGIVVLAVVATATPTIAKLRSA